MEDVVDALQTIARLRRAMPHNKDAMKVCAIAEACVRIDPEPMPKAESRSRNAGNGNFDRASYQREYMRKRRAAEKAGKAAP